MIVMQCVDDAKHNQGTRQRSIAQQGVPGIRRLDPVLPLFQLAASPVHKHNGLSFNCVLYNGYQWAKASSCMDCPIPCTTA